MKNFIFSFYYIIINYFITGWKKNSGKNYLYRLFYLLKGFWPESYIIYSKTNKNFKKQDNKFYISDFQRKVKIEKKIVKTAVILDDKIISELLFPNYINSIAIVQNNMLVYRNSNTLSSIKNLFDNNEKIIIKPRYGGGGRDIKTLQKGKDEFKGNTFYFSTLEKLLTFLSSQNNFIIYPFIKTSGFSNQLFPKTLNTIRILTIINPENNQAVVIGALHRIGTQESLPVDNWSSGGISSLINLKTGKLGLGISLKNDKLLFYDTHPESNIQILNSHVPYWEEIKKIVLKNHNQICFVPYIGWDIVLSDNQILVLEANSNSDVNLFQVHQPLLKDEKILDLFKKNHFI